MRVPSDRSLASWIRELIAEGQIVRFYKCDEWRELRRQTLENEHFECEECRKRGKYRRAVLVHHVNEVRKRPELALSLWYKDTDGVIKKNLQALCFECHEKAHGRAYAGRGEQAQAEREREAEERFPERW